MVLGILTVVMSVTESHSLKDKRQVVKSQLEVIRNRFNVSAAEVGHLDSRRDAELVFACVSNEKSVANRMLDRILRHIESNRLCEVIQSSLEFV